ncbi:MAG TPA: hypothetical protein VGK19_14230 [Capsulimonadaceae bacterium]|jgi:hypothetical protein
MNTATTDEVVRMALQPATVITSGGRSQYSGDSEITENSARHASYIPPDVFAALANEYSELVDTLASDNASDGLREHVYGRVLGVRGALCRLCPVDANPALDPPTFRLWKKSEEQLRDFAATEEGLRVLTEIADSVEERWSESVDRFVAAIAGSRLEDSVPSHLGLLKAIDSMALHLAQRDIFLREHTLPVPMSSTTSTKIRVRLIAMLLVLHKKRFEPSVPAIRSYRETFRIDDPKAFPWWFVDAKLTEKHLNWTYRRLIASDYGWRFAATGKSDN